MERKLEELNNKLKHVHLSDAEKASIRRSVMAFVEAHPLHVPPESTVERPVPSPYWSVFRIFTSGTAMSLAMLLVVVIGGGLSYAAEDSLPGDALYVVKTDINERVNGMLKVSNVSKMEFEQAAIARRLEETAQLIAEGRLTTENKVEIEANIDKHAKAFQSAIEDVEDPKVAIEAASGLESTLKAGGTTLIAIQPQSEKTADSNENATPIIEKVASEIEAVSEIRADAEAKLTANIVTSVSREEAQKEFETAKANVNDARKMLTDLQEEMSREAYEQINAHVSLGEEALKDGAIKFTAEAFNESFVAFQKAERLAGQVTKILTNSVYLDPKLVAEGLYLQFIDETSGGTTTPTATTTPATTTPGATTTSSASLKLEKTDPAATPGAGTEVKTELKVPIRLKIR